MLNDPLDECGGVLDFLQSDVFSVDAGEPHFHGAEQVFNHDTGSGMRSVVPASHIE